jgi:flagellar motor switch protein FliG
LTPARAAEVLAGLAPKVQAETIERLTMLRETDAESINVIEQELAAWVSSQSSRRRGMRFGGVTGAILSAADPRSRDGILANLRTHRRHLAKQFEADTVANDSSTYSMSPRERLRRLSDSPLTQVDALRQTRNAAARENISTPFQPRLRPAAPSAARFQFDELLHLEPNVLAVVLRSVNRGVLLLALAAAKPELIEFIVRRMPRREAKQLRRQLFQLGPTRLSDVEAAQRVVAEAAAKQLARGQAVTALT